MSEFKIKILIFMVPLVLPIGRVDISTAKRSQGDSGTDASKVEHTKSNVQDPKSKVAKSAAGEVSSEISQALTRIETAAKKIGTLKAKLRYDRIQGLLGDKQRRFGTLIYQAGPPPQFDARFTRLILGDTARKIDRRYIFDGHWLARINGEEKTFERRELRPADRGSGNSPADQAGTLNAGPFVLPFDAEKQDILERFDVEKVATAAKDPRKTFHLRLTPKAHLNIDHKRIDLWYDQSSYLPRRVATVDDSKNRSIIELMNVKVNPKLNKRSFDTTPPRDDSWNVQVIPIEREGQGRDG